MNMKTTRARAAVAATGVALLLALSACSSGGASGPKMPDGVTGQVAVETPKSVSQDLSFALGRDDDFISSAAKADGSHGAVVVVENKGDDDVKIDASIGIGPESAWGSFGGRTPANFTLDDAKLPKGCVSNGSSSNRADFATNRNHPYTVKAHSTAVACTIVTDDAAPKSGSLKVNIADADGNSSPQSVEVGDLFTK